MCRQGGETLALRVFNLLHYGHNAQVNALCLTLLLVAPSVALRLPVHSAPSDDGESHSLRSPKSALALLGVPLVLLLAADETQTRHRFPVTSLQLSR